MDTIDVRGLPEPVAEMLQAVVQAYRQHCETDRPGKQLKRLPVKHGDVIGGLTREEIYGDGLRESRTG
jgi:hypothetical protein